MKGGSRATGLIKSYKLFEILGNLDAEALSVTRTNGFIKITNLPTAGCLLLLAGSSFQISSSQLRVESPDYRVKSRKLEL